MKDYKQVTESVFKKAEQRIAEKKRRSAIIRRNAIAASGIAAVLFVVMLQNDDIRSALRSLPKLASSGWWSDNENKSSHSSTTTATTASTTSKTTSVHTTETTTTETTTSETSSTTTSSATTTTATAVTTKPITTTTAPDPKPKSPLDGMVFFSLMGGTTIRSATYDTLELDTGITIGLQYGSIDYRGFFKTGEEIKYVANFAYDAKTDIYYYIDGYLDHPEPRQGHLYFDEPITEMDYGSYKSYYNFDDPNQAVFDGTIPIDYNDILAMPSFTYQEDFTVYKIEARNIKITDREDNYYFVTEDGQKWFFGKADNMSQDELFSIQKGDIISFIGYFAYYDFDKALASLNLVVKIEYRDESNENNRYNYPTRSYDDDDYDDWDDDYYDRDDDYYDRDDDYYDRDDDYYDRDDDYYDRDDDYYDRDDDYYDRDDDYDNSDKELQNSYDHTEE